MTEKISPPQIPQLPQSPSNQAGHEAEVISFGCRLNHHESAILRQELRGEKDIIVINSCAVTAEAERQVKQTIRKKHKAHPDKKIIVTGCAAQIDGASYEKITGVSAVWGNGEKIQAKKNLNRLSNDKLQVGDIMTLRELSPHLLSHDTHHSRGFLEIQNGCNHRCTFCVIPFGRGNSRSHRLDHVIHSAQNMLANGFKEIVLTGVDIASWRSEDNSESSSVKKLSYLIRHLLDALPNLPRLRLSSLDPAEIDDELIELFASEPRLLPHIHLSLQSGSDLILKRMKRRHLRQDIITVVDKLRAANGAIVFGADIIAGFPTESEAMFQDTVDLIQKIPIVFGHVFPYSERPFTPAANIKNKVSLATRKQRAQILRHVCANNLLQWQKSQVGNRQQLLVETVTPDKLAGHNEQFGFITVTLDEANGFSQDSAPHLSAPFSPNQILSVKIVGVNQDGLMANIVL